MFYYSKFKLSFMDTFDMHSEGVLGQSFVVTEVASKSSHPALVTLQISFPQCLEVTLITLQNNLYVYLLVVR